MADGTRPQHTFNFPRPQQSALRVGEIVVDLFAGGGGASEALKQALGRDPDIAINHDDWAVGMHAANHPLTQHLREDVWHADPVRQVAGRAVGWFHASPDCTHFSQAKGGQPRSRGTRSLSWVVLKWAGSLANAGNAPRIISLENVEQILKWGPLIAKRDRATCRVIKLDGTIAAKGERVSVWEQSLIPDKRHAGRTWGQFVAALRALGYTVEWRKLIASDFGAGTSRKRLFLVARFDTTEIQWPAPTHGTGPSLLPLVTAADCLDFSLPCPSIFTRKKPLAEATMRRVAKGVKRYVIDAAAPYIVDLRSLNEGGTDVALGAGNNDRGREVLALHRVSSILGSKAGAGSHLGASDRRRRETGSRSGNPAGAQGQSHRASLCQLAEPRGGITTALITEHANSTAARSWPTNEPLRTQCANVKGGHFALITAFLEQANTGMVGHDAREPMSTIVGKGCTQRLITANLATLRQHSHGADAADPLRTISAGGEHHAVIECTLSPEHEAGALQVAAFLIKYYGTANGVDLRDPLDTITTRDRLALVTVTIMGTPYVIVDIGLRMLRREELFRAQGFPADYIIDRTADGRPLSISRSVKMVGNSVSPPPLLAIARANLAPVDATERLTA